MGQDPVRKVSRVPQVEVDLLKRKEGLSEKMQIVVFSLVFSCRSFFSVSEVCAFIFHKTVQEEIKKQKYQSSYALQSKFTHRSNNLGIASFSQKYHFITMKGIYIGFIVFSALAALSLIGSFVGIVWYRTSLPELTKSSSVTSTTTTTIATHTITATSSVVTHTITAPTGTTTTNYTTGTFLTNVATNTFSMIQSQTKLIGSPVEFLGRQGESVSFEKSGFSLAVGSIGGNSNGSVFLFNFTTEFVQFVHITTDNVSGATAANVGSSVKNSQHYLAFGADHDNNLTGSAFVYFKNITGAFPLQKIEPNDAVGQANFGISITATLSFSEIFVGGFNDNGGNGSVWIFNTSDFLSWNQRQKIVSLTSNEFFGYSIAYSFPNLIVGAPNANGNIGVFYFYQKQGTQYVKRQRFEPTDNIGSSDFGVSMSTSENATYLAVGGDLDNNSIGAVWIFKFDGNDYHLQIKIVPPQIGACSFGYSVAMNGPGDKVVIGAYCSFFAGATFLYTRTNEAWFSSGDNPFSSLDTSAGASEGFAVDITFDGSTIASGATDDAFNATILLSGCTIIYDI